VGDARSAVDLMQTPVAAELIADHVRKAIDYHPLLNLRPYLRSNAIDRSLNDKGLHQEGVWSMLCHAKIALQLAMSQQALMTGDGLLPELRDRLIGLRRDVQVPATPTVENRQASLDLTGCTTESAAGGDWGLLDPKLIDCPSVKRRREALFDLFRFNRLLARNFIVYVMKTEMDRYAEAFLEGRGCTASAKLSELDARCRDFLPRLTRSYELAIEFPRAFDPADWSHNCGRTIGGTLDKENDACLMTQLFPRLRGVPSFEAKRRKPNPKLDVTGAGPAPVTEWSEPLRQETMPLVRFVAQPFVVREMAGTTAFCRIEPGNNWYFVWQRAWPPGETSRAPWGPLDPHRLDQVKDGLPSKAAETCSNLPSPHSGQREEAGWGKLPVYDGNQVFITPAPSQLEMVSGHLKSPEILTGLLKLNRQLSDRIQMLRELGAPSNSSDRTSNVQLLFKLSTIATMR
jgi:hypothetical protein